MKSLGQRAEEHRGFRRSHKNCWNLERKASRLAPLLQKIETPIAATGPLLVRSAAMDGRSGPSEDITREPS